MIIVLVVDENAGGMAADLDAIAKRDGLPMTIIALTTPEIMFGELKQRTPDLLLLHHHWPGMTIAEILERIGEACAATRVIVFTGQPVDVGELISCVRFGVADYWTKRGQLDPSTVFRRIDHYCASAEWTISALRRPSGSLEQLLNAARHSLENNRELARERDVAVSRLNAMKAVERKEMRRAALSVGELAGSAAVMALMLVVVSGFTPIGFRGAIAIVVIFFSFYLLLKGKLSELLIKWGKDFSAKVKSK